MINNTVIVIESKKRTNSSKNIICSVLHTHIYIYYIHKFIYRINPSFNRLSVYIKTPLEASDCISTRCTCTCTYTPFDAVHKRARYTDSKPKVRWTRHEHSVRLLIFHRSHRGANVHDIGILYYTPCSDSNLYPLLSIFTDIKLTKIIKSNPLFLFSIFQLIFKSLEYNGKSKIDFEYDSFLPIFNFT